MYLSRYNCFHSQIFFFYPLKICQDLGWEGPGGRFDILPLVLQANGEQPQIFEIPKELVLEIHIKHPRYAKIVQTRLIY